MREAVRDGAVGEVPELGALGLRPQLGGHIGTPRRGDDALGIEPERRRQLDAVALDRLRRPVDEARRVAVGPPVLLAEEAERAGRRHELTQRVDDASSEARPRAGEDDEELG